MAMPISVLTKKVLSVLPKAPAAAWIEEICHDVKGSQMKVMASLTTIHRRYGLMLTHEKGHDAYAIPPEAWERAQHDAMEWAAQAGCSVLDLTDQAQGATV